MSIVPNPNADFSPAGGVYTELKPFRFWCQKVLPLVYDDSLSYYELLCKVVDYLNKTMEDVDNAVTEVTALHAAYDQLEDYVNNYFSTLDVQQEINNKLDAMAESGELSELISPFVEEWLPGVVGEQIPGVVGEQIGGTVAQQIGATVGAQIGATVAGQISPVVADWLDENITPTTPAVDASLTVAGAAADAKATGDGIDSLKNTITNVFDYEVERTTEIEESGTIANSYMNGSGTIITSASDVYETKYYAVEKNDYVYLYGNQVSLAAALPLAGFTTQTPAGNVVCNVVMVGSDTNTNYNQLYKVPENGYIVVCYLTSRNQLDLYEGLEKSLVIEGIEDDINNLENSMLGRFVKSTNLEGDIFKDNVRINKLEVTNDCLNLYDDKWVATGYIIDSQGNPSVNSNYKVSDFCQIVGTNEHLKLLLVVNNVVSNEDNCYLAFYNENKEFISPRSIGSAYVEIPENAKYFRLAIPTLHEKIMVFNVDNSNYANNGVYSAYMDGYNNSFKFVNDLLTLEESVEEIDARFPIYNADLLCWGDSLTAGAGGGGTNYPKVCSEILGITRLNCGVGGETANTISARQGGNNVIIPAGNVNGNYNSLTDIFGSEIKPLLQGHGYNSGNSVYINGIKCTLSYDSETKYTISGYTGQPITVPVLGKFNGSTFNGKIVCIWVGTNGASFTGLTGIDARIAIIDSMIAHLSHNKYIVFGLSIGTNADSNSDDAKLLAKYGSKFLPVRKLLVEDGLTLAGITPTTQDEADIAAGTVPTSLRYDSIHLNADGYTVLGKMVADKIRSLGYV